MIDWTIHGEKKRLRRWKKGGWTTPIYKTQKSGGKRLVDIEKKNMRPTLINKTQKWKSPHIRFPQLKWELALINYINIDIDIDL